MSAAADVRRLLPAVERAEARARQLRQRLTDAAARFSYERGYRVPLRPEQLKRELEAQR